MGQNTAYGPVWVRLRKDSLIISNAMTGALVPEAPFSKGQDSAGMGLGLSIVTQLCVAMGIKFSKQQIEEELVVTLKF